MDEHPFQQQRQIPREFRQAVTTRQQQEQEADRRWQTEKQDADRILKHALEQAKRHRDQEEARITQKYQAALRTAEDTRAAKRVQAEQLLKKTETETRSRYRSERQQADALLEQTRREARKRQEKEIDQANKRYDEVVKAAEESWAQAQKLAAIDQTKLQEHLGQCQTYLVEAGLSTALIPDEILRASPEGMRGDEDPTQMLEQSLQAVWDARRAIRQGVDDLLRWRETWRCRRNWVIGAVIISVLAEMIMSSIHNARVQEMARQATAIAQAQATATVQAILSARPSSKTVTVYADKDWQDTGMFVLTGERVELRYVSGRWCAWSCGGGIGDTPPTILEPSGGLLTQADWLTIIGRIANQDIFPILGTTTIRVQSPGLLQLRINDPDTSDNAGSVVVTIGVIK